VIVLDTHAWLWLVDDPLRLSKAARAAVEDASNIAISPLSCFEVALLSARGRIRLIEQPRRWIVGALAAARAVELPVDAAVAVRAALLPRDEFPGDPVDRLIYASAQEAGARLVTADRRLRAYDPRTTIW
jgi:PIN domain nuclease of toxin-antitoxin system